tara:strand:- start:152 stop:649 length:498 start_codon:yes stop_codon:yes gene_type:complete
MKKKRLEKEFTDVEIDSWVQEFRRACKEEPDPNEEQFPNDMSVINEHIDMLEDLIKRKPSQELKEDLRVYKALRTGAFKGFATATESLMKRADDIKREEEDEKANQLSTNKVFKFLKKEDKINPNRKISKDEMLKISRLTKQELLDAGIENTDRYILSNSKDENN